MVIPENVFFRVGTETRQWQEGQVLVFDDSFEHEVWHNGTSDRIILSIDVWHPAVTQEYRDYIQWQKDHDGQPPPPPPAPATNNTNTTTNTTNNNIHSKDDNKNNDNGDGKKQNQQNQ